MLQQTTLNRLSLNGLIRRHKNVYEQYRKVEIRHNKLLKELEFLLDMMPKNKESHIDTIIQLVNDEFNSDCTNGSRKRHIIEARHCAVYLLRKYTNLTWTLIANSVRTSHHTTAIHSNQLCQDLMKIDSDYKWRVEKIEDILESIKN